MRIIRKEDFIASSERTKNEANYSVPGFEELIEREWLSAGHPFQSRYESGPFASKSRDNHPTFILFLDCVYQVRTSSGSGLGPRLISSSITLRRLDD